ncbi:MAG: PKD domain-containing protein [Thermoplasmata archaeon]
MAIRLNAFLISMVCIILMLFSGITYDVSAVFPTSNTPDFSTNPAMSTIRPALSALGDFDGDDNTDFVLYDNVRAKLCVCMLRPPNYQPSLALGSNYFEINVPGYDVADLACADINEDGRWDIITSNRALVNVTIWYAQDTEPYFLDTPDVKLNCSKNPPGNITIAKLRPTMYPSILVTMPTQRKVYVFNQSDTGGFSPEQKPSMTLSLKNSMSMEIDNNPGSILVGNFNGCGAGVFDGLYDIAVLNRKLNNVSIYLQNENDPRFTISNSQITLNTPQNPVDFWSADFNSDSFDDIVVINATQISIWYQKNILLGFFSPYPDVNITLPGAQLTQVCAGDFNKPQTTSFVDIAVADKATNSIKIFYQQWSISGVTWHQDWDVNLTVPNGAASDISVGLLNLGIDPDILVPSVQAQSFYIYYRDSNAHREQPTVDLGNEKTGTAETAISFTAVAQDPDGGNIVRFEWDFGDGYTTVTTTQTVTHNYTYDPGLAYPVTYIVKVVVYDDEGDRAWDNVTARISAKVNQPPIITGFAIDKGDRPDNILYEDHPAQITITGTDAEGPIRYYFDPGYPHPDADADNFIQVDGSVSEFIWTEPNTYEIRARVRDQNGVYSSILTKTITVTAKPKPVVTITSHLANAEVKGIVTIRGTVSTFENVDVAKGTITYTNKKGIPTPFPSTSIKVADKKWSLFEVEFNTKKDTKNGPCVIKVSVNDTHGLMTTTSLTLIIKNPPPPPVDNTPLYAGVTAAIVTPIALIFFIRWRNKKKKEKQGIVPSGPMGGPVAGPMGAPMGGPAAGPMGGPMGGPVAGPMGAPMGSSSICTSCKSPLVGENPALCECGAKYHNNCASRLDRCARCGRMMRGEQNIATPIPSGTASPMVGYSQPYTQSSINIPASKLPAGYTPPVTAGQTQRPAGQPTAQKGKPPLVVRPVSGPKPQQTPTNAPPPNPSICLVCKMNIEPGKQVMACTCGAKFHERCSVKLIECPNCHKKMI